VTAETCEDCGRPKAEDHNAQLDDALCFQAEEHDHSCWVLTIRRLRAQLAAAQAELAERRWIPVGERLPMLMDPILFTNGRNVCQGYWDGNVAAREFFWHAMGGNVKMANGSVTHWQPLPNPPKASEP